MYEALQAANSAIFFLAPGPSRVDSTAIAASQAETNSLSHLIFVTMAVVACLVQGPTAAACAAACAAAALEGFVDAAADAALDALATPLAVGLAAVVAPLVLEAESAAEVVDGAENGVGATADIAAGADAPQLLAAADVALQLVEAMASAAFISVSCLMAVLSLRLALPALLIL